MTTTAIYLQITDMFFQKMDTIKDGPRVLTRLKNLPKHAKRIAYIAEKIKMENQELKQKIASDEIFAWQFNETDKYLGAIIISRGKYHPHSIPANKIKPSEQNNKLSRFITYAQKSLHYYEEMKDEIDSHEYKTISAMIKLWIKAAQKIQSTMQNLSYMKPHEYQLAIYDNNPQIIAFEFLTE